MRRLSLLSQTRAIALCGLSVFGGCAANQPVTYQGLLAPQAGTCDPPQRAVLMKRGKFVEFTPSQGVLILNGQISAQGAVSASFDQIGADRKPYHLRLVGTLAGQAITATYVTPRCRYTVSLKQKP